MGQSEGGSYGWKGLNRCIPGVDGAIRGGCLASKVYLCSVDNVHGCDAYALHGG
jgi:hypothetical protein